MNKLMDSVKIAILGEYDSNRPSRALLGPALEHAAKALEVHCEYDWFDDEAASKDC